MGELIRSIPMAPFPKRSGSIEVKKRAKIRNRYNKAPHLTQDTNGKMTTSQLDITNKLLLIAGVQMYLVKAA